jgi:acetylornithine deacetylase/succinyl-diaminopimelate desuccinylase-like protein
VANQDPEKIRGLVEDHVRHLAPSGVKVDVKGLHGGTPVMVPVDNPFLKAGQDAVEAAFGKRPVLVREGASIPITAVFLEDLNAPSIMVGFGLDSDNIHGPDEHMPLSHFRNGIAACVHLYKAFAGVVIPSHSRVP